jgi:hypothetical protein
MVIVSGTWSATDVNALLAGLIGVAATLLGSFTTYLFQSRTAERAQSEIKISYEWELHTSADNRSFMNY